jgi:hypothetical protein
MIFNADSLRNYLNDTSNGKIAYVKLMFAHTLDYINSGKQSKVCGYNDRDLTIIVVGFDYLGNYVYNAQNMVIDKGVACPHTCPSTGTASSYFLPNTPTSRR